MRLLLVAVVSLILSSVSVAQEPFIPRRQTKPPGPPKSPQEAIAAMTVPAGFSVELVAAEPDLVNPVAMTIDEKGRFWVCESVEYPRHEPGPGRDRVKILEDTNGDGKVDKTTIFADGLNIPSGIAVGYGGVWVANAPDLLFLQDTDGDGKADKREVVVTGFGRFDTHELPNSLTWGPDGWLYGLNGVFNPAKVEQDGDTHEFTCAVFRIHPVTRKFELFAEGTSNPWGIAFDPEGSLFVSACVIDHFWHLAETGYYRRQAGAYPPHTWVLESIVDHTHQMAAYCGLHYCDSDAFPPEWRNIFLMGNIHGNCINADVVERNGSTYVGKPRPDFLSANDVWFMTVEQMTGPDGSLYVLDWYDRYHCYQDASADPRGVDRLHGRLYRVRYKETPYVPVGFDLAKETDEQLIRRLEGGNDFLRATATRLLAERLSSHVIAGTPTPTGELGPTQLEAAKSYRQLRDILWKPVLEGATQEMRLNALSALVSGGGIEDNMILSLVKHEDASLRAGGVRAWNSYDRSKRAKKQQEFRDSSLQDDATVQKAVFELAKDPSPVVRLQVATATRSLDSGDAVRVLSNVLKATADDPLIPAIVWQNLYPQLEGQSDRLLTLFESAGSERSAAANAVLARTADWLLSQKSPNLESVSKVVTIFVKGGDFSGAGRVLRGVRARLSSGEIGSSARHELAVGFAPIVTGALKDEKNPLHRDAILLATTWGDSAAALMTAKLLGNRQANESDRLEAAEALIAGGDEPTIHRIAHLAADPATGTTKLRGDLLGALGRSESTNVAHAILQNIGDLNGELRPRAIELLTQRPAWGKALIAAIEGEQISKDAVNVNQVRRLVGSSDPETARRATAIWGTIREGRSPEREQIIASVRKQLESTAGDPFAGQKVFARVCAQCHKMYGEGEEVGPDITRSGRNDYDQLLSNVLDPSLVIGAGYQAHTVLTIDGRVLTGLVVEDTPQRLVLKLQGGKLEAIPRSDVEEDIVSATSMMPEGLERQVSAQELADLFAFLALDRPPSDKEAQRLPGAPEPKR